MLWKSMREKSAARTGFILLTVMRKTVMRTMKNMIINKRLINIVPTLLLAWAL